MRDFNLTHIENALEVTGLCKQYENFTLDNLSFTLPKGYVMGFIGPNGSGKTTTIKSILGSVKPQSGTIRLFEHPHTEKGWMDAVGVVMDTPYYPADWTTAEVGRAHALFYRAWSAKTFDALLEKYHLPAGKKIKEFSKGMKTKLMLATALSHGAKLLLLDEPTGGLDPVARDELLADFRSYMQAEDCSILFSTHITADLEKIADYITFIIDGKLIYSGEKDALLDRYLLLRGDPKHLDPELRGAIIGYRESSVGYVGLIESQNRKHFETETLIKPTLDEIIVYINRKEGRDEQHD